MDPGYIVREEIKRLIGDQMYIAAYESGDDIEVMFFKMHKRCPIILEALIGLIVNPSKIGVVQVIPGVDKFHPTIMFDNTAREVHEAIRSRGVNIMMVCICTNHEAPTRLHVTNNQEDLKRLSKTIAGVSVDLFVDLLSDVDDLNKFIKRTGLNPELAHCILDGDNN